ncbi:MAG: magnesium chelatase [Chloracidobacterium sp.]|nr:magnesium chelatase [Chloracidobacterium sp.]MDW8218521.1 magnesium chelatase [Acidobacteriota bacterium]
MALPTTFGELKNSVWGDPARQRRSVKDEMRENLIAKLERGEKVFPGIIGYEDSVEPYLINAILSRHNLILLGRRGQAKSRILRSLTSLLDEVIPVIAGSEINDNPFAPVSAYGRRVMAEQGDAAPIAWRKREERYVEKLATPDVTIADIIGDIDPIKAAKSGNLLSDESTIHFGLLPRANRGIFAINELPDLAGKIQVGLFNIMQEGDVQIKGFPVRLKLDVALVFSANPEDYTARGKIITPLKDRIGSEILTHYPQSIEEGVQITAQEAWTNRPSRAPIHIPKFIREVVETIAFVAREDQRIDRRSGVSQRLPISLLENVVSSAEHRALRHHETVIVPRIADIYAALPAITGKIELEYEGEQLGAERIARELIRTACGRVYDNYLATADTGRIIEWFNQGRTLKISEMESSTVVLEKMRAVRTLIEVAEMGGYAEGRTPAHLVAAAELVLEGLHAQRKVSRSEERGYGKAAPADRRRGRREDDGDDYGNWGGFGSLN